ncbi:MAG: endolytic transglycosylase MltG [Polyangiaceae bacterium]|nr:endolytic transglycosylase MltG [Polyangiaceae bacterium]
MSDAERPRSGSSGKSGSPRRRKRVNPASEPKSEKSDRSPRRLRRSTGVDSADSQSRIRTLVWWLLAAFGVLVALASIYLFLIFSASRGPGGGRTVELTFERDEPMTSVVAKLEGAGLIRSPRLFSLYARLVSLRVQPGVHLLTDDVSADELIHRLERRGRSSKAKVTIPEGFTRFDIAKRLESMQVASHGAFLDATIDANLLRELAIDSDSFEGYLFPATYEFGKDTDPRDVVRRMKSEFDKRFGSLEKDYRFGRAALESTLGWGRKEIVTLASMVEKEAAVDDERSVVASVFLNRLRDPSFKPRLLQSDPTAGYGCLVLHDRVPSCKGFAGKITRAVNTDPLNTYSTYVHEGLPPGPIANPGIKSLLAVLEPANTKYLYFVAREGRKHTFSETFEEHNTAVKDLRERTNLDRLDRLDHP